MVPVTAEIMEGKEWTGFPVFVFFFESLLEKIKSSPFISLSIQWKLCHQSINQQPTKI